MRNLWEEFTGPNAAYVLELYERYRQDPGSVDAQTRAFFDAKPAAGWDGTAPAARGCAGARW